MQRVQNKIAWGLVGALSLVAVASLAVLFLTGTVTGVVTLPWRFDSGAGEAGAAPALSPGADTLRFNGVLTDAAGAPLPEGNRTMTFRIFDVDTGGTALWEETQVVTVKKSGRISVSLGSVVPLPAGLFDGSGSLFLEIQVEAEVLTPRQELEKVPRAFFSDKAANADHSANSDRATNADKADRATNADKADRATNADKADRATNADNADLLDGLDSTAFWQTTGNSGTSPGINFLGTTDDAALELHVNGSRALRLEPNDNGPNVIGGFSANSVTFGVAGATISGGGWGATQPNRVTDDFSTVGGGAANQAGNNNAITADAPFATVGGGESNTASGKAATVAGGQGNTADYDFASVGGGRLNTSGTEATVGGGFSNTASGQSATVGGGDRNTANSGFDTVGGGQLNFANGGTVGGGWGNTAVAGGATVSGGETNTASGNYATVGGGAGNIASDRFAAVGGGRNNTAKGFQSATVAGGEANVASGQFATVGGGDRNLASGEAATVPGGTSNSAGGDFSFAAGSGARIDALHAGSFLFADRNNSIFDSSAANEFAVRSTGGARFVSAIGGNGNPTAGVSLAPGGNSWSAISDRSLKANFEAADGQDILERLASIPIETWNLKSQDESIRHIGPMAQDFYAAFGVGEDDKHITTIDADGVALAAIQGLYELAQEKDAQISTLQERLAALEENGGGTAAAGPSSASGLPTTWPLVGGLLLGALALGHLGTVALGRSRR